MLKKYYEMPDVLHLGAEECRAWYLPEDNAKVISLNGVWSFTWYNSVEDVPETIGTDPLCGAVDMPVPSAWQNQGFDNHQYTNIRYPFPYDPPYAPRENPCGVYRRTFVWEGNDRCYLNFDGVDSCYYVWVNGQFVGYSTVSHSGTEFEITDKVIAGENQLTVAVVKWSAGSYLEDQDKFRSSGIFRDVYLLARPQAHIRDLTINGTAAGEVTCKADFKGGEMAVTAKLYAPCGCLLAEKALENGEVAFTVENPKLWTAETPVLYTLRLEAEGETIVQRVGLRTVSIENGVLLVNGAPVLFRGANRHDSDPFVGPAVTREHVERDMRLMKEHNINAIRTSHYPNSPYFYEMCDEFGFFVIAESDIEIHGTALIAPKPSPNNWALLADDPSYHDAIVDRVQRNVMQHKNRASIVIWSLGNEAAYGVNFEDAARWCRTYDPTRMVHYESFYANTEGRVVDHTCLDLHSRMYPSCESIEEYFKNGYDEMPHRMTDMDGTTVPKPYVLCEFAHAMGNGPGDFEEYFQLFIKYPGLCGGFVWEWCDHAVCVGHNKDGQPKMRYGGDFGEFPHDGNFCMDGVVLPDRTVSKSLLEYKNVLRPARCYGLTADGKGVVVRNMTDYTDLSEYASIEWKLLEKGIETASGACEIPSVKPWEYVDVNLNLPEAGEDAAVLVSYVLKHDVPLLKAGHILGFDQVVISEAQAKVHEAVCGNVTAAEEGKNIVITGENFRYVFDTHKGTLSEMVVGNRTLIEKPIEYNVWRAPTDNDMYVRKVWAESGYDRALVRTYGTQWAVKDGCVEIVCDLSLAPIYLRRVATIRAKYVIDAAGMVAVDLDVTRPADADDLPRFGLRLFLPKAFEEVAYLGYGPGESYVDCRRSAYRAAFTGKVGEMEAPYLKPQECGSRYGCDSAELAAPGMKLEVKSATPFSFNAGRYTQEELTAVPHWDELTECGSTVLCVDYKLNGIGSNSCGPALNKKYAFSDKEFRFAFTMKPVME